MIYSHWKKIELACWGESARLLNSDRAVACGGAVFLPGDNVGPHGQIGIQFGAITTVLERIGGAFHSPH